MDYCVVPTDRYGVIYLATHLKSGKMYVGQTVRPLRKRWKDHHRKPNTKRSISYLSRAMAKHGQQEFVVETLDYAFSQDTLDHKERFWIAFLDTISPSGYNLLPGGLSGNRGVPMTEETRQKLSLIHRARYASGYQSPTLGRKRPPEEVAAMSARRKGQRMPVFYKSIICRETGQIFQSVLAAAQWLHDTKGLKSRSMISRALHHPTRTAGGYHWYVSQSSPS